MFWNVHQNVANFTGRKSLLTEMKSELDISRSFPYSAICMSGLGGIGKTECAARYIHIYRKDYENIFWIKADSLEVSLANLVSYFNDGCNYESVEVLMQIISKQVKDTKCLFVLDNAVDFKSVKLFLQNLIFQINPHIIITSQNSQWRSRSVKRIDMDVFLMKKLLNSFRRKFH